MTNEKNTKEIKGILHHAEVPNGHEHPIKEDGIEYVPSGAILRGIDDEQNAYWNSFLPIFFDRINIITRRVMACCVKPYGLTSIYAEYLIALNLREGLTMVELSKFLDVDTANTNRIIRVLKEKELIWDDRTSARSKKFKIFLTEEGKALADLIMSETHSTMNGFFKGVPKFSIDNLKFTLIKILHNADPNFENYVDSKWVNPFFTYLGLGWDEESTEALKYGAEEYEEK